MIIAVPHFVSASSIDKQIRPLMAGLKKVDQARIVGEELAKRAIGQRHHQGRFGPWRLHSTQVV